MTTPRGAGGATPPSPPWDELERSRLCGASPTGAGEASNQFGRRQPRVASEQRGVARAVSTLRPQKESWNTLKILIPPSNSILGMLY